MKHRHGKPSNELFAEVFGFPVTNTTKFVIKNREKGYCPFLDGPCQKSTYQDSEGLRRPMGVCSMFHQGKKIAITCPHRLKEAGLIFQAAADFCFPNAKEGEVVHFPEIRLPTNKGRAGNLDHVLVYHRGGKVIDFAGMELQSVYFSGMGIRNDFIRYINQQKKGIDASPKQTGAQRPDYRSSSKKRLLPQLIEKGPIFSNWKKKFVVAIHEDFFQDLLRSVTFKKVKKENADFAWIIVGYGESTPLQMKLEVKETLFSDFESVLDAFLLSAEDVPDVQDFLLVLQDRISKFYLNGKARNG